MFRVVVVDDTADLRTLTCHILESDDDLEVVAVAGDGREGFEVIERLRPELAIIDMNMPLMGGVELIRQLRSVGLTTSVIAYSSDDAALEAALTAGADLAVRKAGPVNGLVRAVTKIRVRRAMRATTAESTTAA